MENHLELTIHSLLLKTVSPSAITKGLKAGSEMQCQNREYQNFECQAANFKLYYEEAARLPTETGRRKR